MWGGGVPTTGSNSDDEQNAQQVRGGSGGGPADSHLAASALARYTMDSAANAQAFASVPYDPTSPGGGGGAGGGGGGPTPASPASPYFHGMQAHLRDPQMEYLSFAAQREQEQQLRQAQMMAALQQQQQQLQQPQGGQHGGQGIDDMDYEHQYRERMVMERAQLREAEAAQQQMYEAMRLAQEREQQRQRERLAQEREQQRQREQAQAQAEQLAAQQLQEAMAAQQLQEAAEEEEARREMAAQMVEAAELEERMRMELQAQATVAAAVAVHNVQQAAAQYGQEEDEGGGEDDDGEEDEDDEPKFEILEERRHDQEETIVRGTHSSNKPPVRGKPAAVAAMRAAAEARAAELGGSQKQDTDDEEDEDENDEEPEVAPAAAAVPTSSPQRPKQLQQLQHAHHPPSTDESSEDESESDSDSDVAIPAVSQPARPPKEATPSTKPSTPKSNATYSSDSDDSDDDLPIVRPSAKAKPKGKRSTSPTPTSASKKKVVKQKKPPSKKKAEPADGGSQGGAATTAAAATATPTPKKKKKPKSKSDADTPLGVGDTPATVSSSTTPGATPASAKKAKGTKSSAKKLPTSGRSGGAFSGGASLGPVVSLDDPVPDITKAEYENVEALMVQFCRVPLLAEFSRPVSLLHPELMPIYSKVVKHPIDLGRVCRSIRRRLYKNTRAIRLDMWRIFANCVKYHTHPSTKDNAVPSFISIALHLREYFNALWQEYMVPSDVPLANPSGKQLPGKGKGSVSTAKVTFDKREEARKKRLSATSTTVLSAKCIEKTAAAVQQFLSWGGRVDNLDVEPLFNNGDDEEEDEDDDLDAVVDNLTAYKSRLMNIAASNQEYSMDELERDLKACYTGDMLFDDRPSMRNRVRYRLDRLLGKIVVPIYETNCRGVNQSSVWGCMAAAIWARESSKKAYWPALVLGILAPDDQKEEWHAALTDRNEARLPEKLRADLQTGKKKAEQGLRRQSSGAAEQMSFFLVEFMGTHEFVWVKEADIIENFDPEDDPNQNIAVSGSRGNVTKKKRPSRGHGHTPASAKMIEKAIEEGKWALEEFEMQLNDTCGDLSEDEEDEEQEDVNYSYAFLCESDDEADEADQGGSDPLNELSARSMSDDEEMNELLATEGLIDYSAAGRKNAKRRAAALKKQKADAKRAALKKEKEEQAKKAKIRAKQAKMEQSLKKKNEAQSATKAKAKAKAKSLQLKKLEREREKEERREQRELERRRKKRERERERVLKEQQRKKKRKRTSDSPDGGDAADTGKRRRRNGIPDKRGRASAIVRGYLTRLAKREDMKGLGLGGVMTIPIAGVGSSGLLGLAIAFRAAAGEIDGVSSAPDGGATNDPASSKLKPWDRIDAESALTSEERCKNLEKQKELLEKEVERLEKAKERRRVLIEEALRKKEARELEVARLEKEARKTNMPKKKKPVKKADGDDSKRKEGEKEEGGDGVDRGEDGEEQHSPFKGSDSRTDTSVSKKGGEISEAERDEEIDDVDASVATKEEEEDVSVSVSLKVDASGMDMAGNQDVGTSDSSESEEDDDEEDEDEMSDGDEMEAEVVAVEDHNPYVAPGSQFDDAEEE